jgi:hypothetical protein
MNAESEMRTAPSVDGHMIMLGTAHWIALYERNRFCYVAEFRDGHGEFAYATAWFGFNAGVLRYCHNQRRTALFASKPLTPEMLEQIEQLHRESDARQEWMLAVPRNILRLAKRCLHGLASWTRGVASTGGH